MVVLRLNGACEFGEGRWEPVSRVDIHAQFVVASAERVGEFIDRTGRDDWITAHEIGAFVVVVLALASAVLAVVALRRTHSALAFGAIALLGLIIAQTGLGEAITRGSADELIVLHVPIAMLIFGLGVYLSSLGARVRRSAARATGTIR